MNAATDRLQAGKPAIHLSNPSGDGQALHEAFAPILKAHMDGRAEALRTQDRIAPQARPAARAKSGSPRADSRKSTAAQRSDNLPNRPPNSLAMMNNQNNVHFNNPNLNVGEPPPFNMNFNRPPPIGPVAMAAPGGAGSAAVPKIPAKARRASERAVLSDLSTLRHPILTALGLGSFAKFGPTAVFQKFFLKAQRFVESRSSGPSAVDKAVADIERRPLHYGFTPADVAETAKQQAAEAAAAT